MVQQIDSSVGLLTPEELEMVKHHREEKARLSGLIAPSNLVSTIDVAGLKDGAVWIENLAASQSRFVDSNLGSFMLEAHGKMNSIQQVDIAFTRNPYLQRAEKRTRIRWVNDVEAREILDKIVLDDVTPASARLQQYLTEEASTNAGRRFITDLPENAEQKSSISSDTVWDNKTVPTIVPKATKSTDVPVMSPTDVLTDRVREGEWTPEVHS